jgi:hypothetical protein
MQIVNNNSYSAAELVKAEANCSGGGSDYWQMGVIFSQSEGVAGFLWQG